MAGTLEVRAPGRWCRQPVATADETADEFGAPHVTVEPDAQRRGQRIHAGQGLAAGAVLAP